MIDISKMLQPGDTLIGPNGRRSVVVSTWSPYQYKLSFRQKYQRVIRWIKRRPVAIRRMIGYGIEQLGFFIQWGHFQGDN